ncbi:MAM domain [Trinorchestia longiramus]|nr:MAM domain [Trinorchestia longiramus]
MQYSTRVSQMQVYSSYVLVHFKSMTEPLPQCCVTTNTVVCYHLHSVVLPPQCCVTTSTVLRHHLHSDKGKFLFMGLYPMSNYSNTMAHIRSPYFKESGEKCRLEMQLNIKGFNDIPNPVRMLVETSNHTTFVLLENINNATHEWLTKGMNVGSYEKFRIILEVIFGFDRPAYVAFDGISLVNCATDRPGMHVEGECDGIKCPDCIQRRYICDLESNCKDGEDENHCDAMGLPEGARCDFEQQDWCGWQNAATNAVDMDWKLHHGETDKDKTGPSFDHTYRNESGLFSST